MVKTFKLSRVVRKHSQNCRSNGKWSGLLKGAGTTENPFYGNFAANPFVKSEKHHLWYIISCNDPRCDGEKAVHFSVLRDA